MSLLLTLSVLGTKLCTDNHFKFLGLKATTEKSGLIVCQDKHYNLIEFTFKREVSK